MGDTDTCLSLRRLARFLSCENGWLFPRSQPDPSAGFISHSLSLSPRLSVSLSLSPSLSLSHTLTHTHTHTHTHTLFLLYDLSLPLSLDSFSYALSCLILTSCPSFDFAPFYSSSCLSFCLSFFTLWPICFSSQPTSTECREAGRDGGGHPFDYHCWLIDSCERRVRGCVYADAFLHAHVREKTFVIRLQLGCLPSHNKCRYLARSDTTPPPTPTHTHMHTYTYTHTAVLSEMSCQSLLGLAFSLARGLDRLSEELNSGPFPLQYFRKAANKKGRQTGTESQGAFMTPESLCLIICWNVSRAVWILKFMSVPARLQSSRPNSNNCVFFETALRSFSGYVKGQLWGREIKLTKAHLPYEYLYLKFRLHSFQMSPWRTRGWLKGIYLCFSGRKWNRVASLQEPDQQVLLGGQCFPPEKAEPKPDILQNDFGHNHWCSDDCKPSKISTILKKSREIAQSGGERPADMPNQFSQTWRPPSQKNSHQSAPSQVSPSEDGWDLWNILQT